jgi:hypothetical protein
MDMNIQEVTTARDARRSSRRGHPLARVLGLGVAGLLAAYLVVRGVIEFFTINYSDPASYRDDWGGPSLAGVFAVHSGPAVLIVPGPAGRSHRFCGPLPVTRYNARSKPSQPVKEISGSALDVT